MPGACQSRTVTEPQRERSRLKLNYSHQKRLLRLFDEHSEIFVKFCFTKISRVLKRAKKSQNFFDTLKKQAYGVPFSYIVFFLQLRIECIPVVGSDYIQLAVGMTADGTQKVGVCRLDRRKHGVVAG